jgi:PHD/YefM family antitoxin component YafN of YafNO toxin-antitoxin module
MSVDLDDAAIRYVTDEDGRPEAAIVPIETWREMTSEHTTQKLLSHPKMRERLLTSIASDDVIPLDEAMKRVGISWDELLEEAEHADD